MPIYKRQAVNEDRYRAVMIAAALRGTTVKRWIDEAIDQKLERERLEREKVTMSQMDEPES